ncbi:MULTISPECIES: FtsK/SpoIIIE family DNA translocase [Sphingobacterium]|uniref:DNA translocase FtsK 4TM domain-containing protein n=1 Tax=Sphingobacterium tenebrionis TaxID=3111775 RepID=A0ABU8I2B2_9SPHI|nr:DNA translocase FtsK [Sphingobacterium sp. CZ-2]QBR11017.1 DNA translocase FtsK [Sphingobacterium sp. CZ-2]
MARLNTFKNGSGSAGTKKTKNTTLSYQKRAKTTATKTFDQINFSEGQRKALKIFGLFLLLLAGLFTVAFVSYLFTWKADQSYIAATNGGWSTLFQTGEEIQDEGTELPLVENKLGKFGALLANQFIYEWFGVASFLFIVILFVTGYKFLYKRSIFPIWKTWVYSLISIILLSVTFGFIQDFIAETPHILEGKFGFWTNQILKAQIGQVGTAGVLIFIVLTALVLLYNYDLRLSFRSKNSDEENDEFEDEEELLEDSQINKIRANRQNEVATHTYSYPQPEPEQELEDEEELTPEEEELSLSLPLQVNTPKPSNQVVSNTQENEIEFSIEQPTSNKVEAPIQEEPSLVVEKPIEEKPITANDLVEKFGEYDPKLDLSGYQYPTLDLLKDYGTGKITINQQELEGNKNRIVETLRNYSIEIEHIKATIGPTVTLYEIIPKPGVRISKIKNLEDDIALSLAALGIRIIAPMPGKGTIGIEVPSSTPEMVSMRSILATEKYQKTDMDLPIALGKTISNEVYIADLAKMPHLLVAGATGQGKSVGINAILTSLLFKKHPAELKFVLVDPKKVELSLFKKIERHFLAKLPNEDDAIITDTKKVINTLNSLCIEMDQRYDLLKNAQVRNLKEYNVKFINRRLNPEEGHRFLPFIVLIIDEFADLMMTAGKEVETPIARLAQLARAVGIHLVIATQRPSVNIITGTIKANFPARLAFRVLSKVDSRTILDSGGADQLIGRGDMLLATGSDLIRIQCAFVDTPEVDQISDFIGGQRGYPSAHYLPEYVGENSEGGSSSDFDMDSRDPMFEEAARLIVMHQQGSTSLIQRKLKLGYNRAGRIIDQLESAGIVGPFEGSKAREVLYPDEYSLEQYLETLR